MIHSASNNLNVSIFVDTVVEGSIQRYHSYYCVLITPVETMRKRIKLTVRYEEERNYEKLMYSMETNHVLWL